MILNFKKKNVRLNFTLNCKINKIVKFIQITCNYFSKTVLISNIKYKHFYDDINLK